MASLREIKDRIGSVRSTLQVTSAMKLVSSAKLRKAQKVIEGMRPYSDALSDILSAVGPLEQQAAVATADAPVAVVCLCIQTENICKMPWGIHRLRSRKWINDVTGGADS